MGQAAPANGRERSARASWATEDTGDSSPSHSRGAARPALPGRRDDLRRLRYQLHHDTFATHGFTPVAQSQQEVNLPVDLADQPRFLHVPQLFLLSLQHALAINAYVLNTIQYTRRIRCSPVAGRRVQARR